MFFATSKSLHYTHLSRREHNTKHSQQNLVAYLLEDMVSAVRTQHGLMLGGSHGRLFDDAVPVTTDSLTVAPLSWEAPCSILDRAPQLQASGLSLCVARTAVRAASCSPCLSGFSPSGLRTAVSGDGQAGCFPLPS